MLRITVNKSAAAAKKYYSEEYYSEGKYTLKYYNEKDETIGNWNGKAAEKLGLKDGIKKEDFASLCDNQVPGTKDKLTERNNAERRVGYDFTFNASKSVSLAYTFANENEKKEILQAFQDSVKDAMFEIEANVQTRVRKSGSNENRQTGNIVYGEFTHFTSRPVDGIPDPHLHAHCFVLNATYDDTEQKWKAAEFGQIKKDAPYYEALFHSTLAEKLSALGYEIERSKNGFEIKGIERETIEKFSRRTEEIENLAEKNNITDKKEKSAIGAQSRESKRNSIDPEQQFQAWENRLTQDEINNLKGLKKSGFADEKKKENFEDASLIIQQALNQHLERKSVTTDKEVLSYALKSSIGEVSPAKIKNAFKSDTSIISVEENLQTFITTKEALNEENNLIAKAYSSKGAFRPIAENYSPSNPALTSEQKKAVEFAMSTSDGIIIIEGKAGTGKTTLMKEVQQGVVSSGNKFFAFAPSAEASRMVQRKEGFENATTVASLIQNTSLHPELKNSILWIDEAGLLSNKDMNKVLDLASAQNARVILTGDTKQHNSVERGDALRTLMQEAKLPSIQVNKIQRQKEVNYKEAVELLGKSDLDKGFKKLENIGAIHEVENNTERIEKIADDYYTSSMKRKNGKGEKQEVLVISPTHKEGETVTTKIRERLKKENVVAEEENKFNTFRNLQLTETEKKNAENYKPDNWLIFHQNSKGFKAGSRYQITEAKSKNQIEVRDYAGKKHLLSLDKSSNYNVFETKEVGLGKGDKIRLTGNGKAKDGKHLFNGTMFKVNGFDKKGNIKLSNGSTMAKDYGHFTLGYVVTSFASQGKTVDKVIISQSSMSLRASSKEQFYVSVSRGRNAVSIYTDDKQDLLQAVKQSNERRSAKDLIRRKKSMDNALTTNRVSVVKRIKETAVMAAEKVKNSIMKQMNIEYELQR